MKPTLLIQFLLACVFWSEAALAATYRDALKAYAKRSYEKSYKIALDRAKNSSGKREVEALILAGAAAWEIDRLGEAQMLFSTALTIDPEAELPSVVKKKGLKRAFERARMEPERETGRSEKIAVITGAPATTLASLAPAAPLVAASAAPAVAPMVQTGESPQAFNKVSTYLPLGLNQLYQGKFFLGLAVGAVQGFAINTAIQKAATVRNANSSADREYQIAAAANGTNDPEFLEFLDENESFVKQNQQEGQIAIAVASLTYLFSVFEAGLNPPRNVLAENEPNQGNEKEKVAERSYNFDLFYDGKGLSGFSLGMNF